MRVPCRGAVVAERRGEVCRGKEGEKARVVTVCAMGGDIVESEGEAAKAVVAKSWGGSV